LKKRLKVCPKKSSVVSSLPSKSTLQTLQRAAQAELARRSADDFCEFVLKDDKGMPVKQSAIHKEINYHIDECRKRGLNCGILAPWRHGKTESVVIARTLQFLGENPNNRIFIVCNADDNAASRVSSISKYIEYDPEYRLVHPNIIPEKKDDWGKHKLVVQRTSKSKDGSVEAWGITTSGTGAGCDIMIFDDPVDLRNAILNPALRTQVKESFRNVWCSRVASNGFRIYIATVWHSDDLTSEILNNPEWSFLVIKVSEDFSYFDCESPLKGKFSIPLWEEKWPKEVLIKRYREIGQRAFNRGFRQQALSDEDKTFPSANSIFRTDLSISDVVHSSWMRVVGIDPFGQWVVLFVLALSPEGRRFPIEVRRGKWQPKETVDQIIDTFRIHRPQLMVCENNASQDAIVQWALEKGHQIPITPFTTGSQKVNPEMGLPGMEVEFANGSWICAMGHEHPPDCSCGFCVWRRELNEHPLGVAADTVMASWFAREGARALVSGALEESSEEVITGEEIGLDRVLIGDY
jgi:hypothetical protein